MKAPQGRKNRIDSLSNDGQADCAGPEFVAVGQQLQASQGVRVSGFAAQQEISDAARTREMKTKITLKSR